MKKVFLLVTSFLVLFLFSFITTNVVNADSVNRMSSLPSMSYDKAMKSDKPFLLVFYADWCTYCQRLMPKVKAMQQEYKDSYNFVLLNFDDEANKSKFADYQVEGFPTVYIIDGKYRKKAPISDNARADEARFSKTMKSYLNMRKKF